MRNVLKLNFNTPSQELPHEVATWLSRAAACYRGCDIPRARSPTRSLYQIANCSGSIWRARAIFSRVDFRTVSLASCCAYAL